jgi:hypothetical protein
MSKRRHVQAAVAMHFSAAPLSGLNDCFVSTGAFA